MAALCARAVKNARNHAALQAASRSFVATARLSWHDRFVVNMKKNRSTSHRHDNTHVFATKEAGGM